MFVRCCESQLVTGWRDNHVIRTWAVVHHFLNFGYFSHIYLKETLLLLLTGNPTSGRRQGRKEEGEASPGKMYRHNHWRQLDGSRPCCLPCHGHRCFLLCLQEPLLCRDEEVVPRGLQGPLKDEGWSQECYCAKIKWLVKNTKPSFLLSASVINKVCIHSKKIYKL